MTESVFDCSAAFGAGEVGELEAADAIAHGPDVRVGGSQVRIDLDVVAVVDHDARFLETDAARLGTAADGDEEEVCLDGGAVIEVGFDAFMGVVDLFDAAAWEEGDSLLLDDAAPLLYDTRVNAGEHLGEDLNDGDARAESGEKAGEFASHHAAADHEHVLGDSFQPEDAVGGHHAGMIHVDARQPRGFGADADDQVVELVALIAGHHCVAVDDALRANDFHALAFARCLDTFAHREDDLLLALHHPGEVDLGLWDANAERRCVADLAQQVRACEQRLGGNASPVEARTAELGALDHGDVRSQLRGAKRSNIAGGPAAEHHDALAHAVVGVVTGTVPTAPLRPRRDVANASETMRSSSS